jgi:hypothetical protein
MADTTFGVKVPEDLKEQLTKLMQDSGLTGKDFMQSLVNVYQVEKTKEGVPEVAQDLKELQSLTQRINNIYLNLGYRIDNLMKSKEVELQEQLRAKDKIIYNLQLINESLNVEKKELTKTFNTSVNDKNELNTRVNELTESNNSIKELNEEYKSKFEMMAGLVDEYKNYKIEVEEYKKLLADAQTRRFELENSIKERDLTIKTLNEDKEKKEKAHKDEISNSKLLHTKQISELADQINKLRENHKNEIENLNKKHEEKAEFEKEKALLDQDKKNQEYINKLNEGHNKKVRELLDLLEESKKQKSEPVKTENKKE